MKRPLEIELKAYLYDYELIKKKIISLNGESITTEFQEDLYFSHPNKNFAETDEVLRIRKINKTCLITYKGPKLGGRAKSRIEEEVEVADFNVILKILVSLGFGEVKRVKKKREIFRIKDINICIDRVDGLDEFIELEIISSNRKDAEKALFDLAKNLGLTKFESKSYLELLIEK